MYFGYFNSIIIAKLPRSPCVARCECNSSLLQQVQRSVISKVAFLNSGVQKYLFISAGKVKHISVVVLLKSTLSVSR